MRLIIALPGMVLAALIAQAQDTAFDWSDSNVTQLAPGVLHAELRVEGPRPKDLDAIRVDMGQPGLRLVTTPRCAEWKENAEETEREPARDFVREAHEAGIPMVVAINGDAFSPWPAPWNQGTRTNLNGLAISNGLVVSPATGTPSLLVDREGRVRIAVTNADTDVSDVVTAISGFALCLENGAPVSGNDTIHPRTGIGLSQDGRYLVFVLIDGRRRASQGATTDELGAWLKHFGAHTGINLDGGGSTSLVWWNDEKEDPDKTVLLNFPVGDGVNWLERDADQERRMSRPRERYNGNHLGVVVVP